MATEPSDTKNLDIYGSPPITWTAVRERLERDIPQAPGTGGPDRHTFWLATTDPDGRPHVMGVGVIPIDGAFYFNAGRGTRKAKNLERDPRCVLTVATHEFDLVIEGRASIVTDDATQHKVAERFSPEWECTVQDGALTAEYSAPSAGPPPWHVFEVVAESVYAIGTIEPYGATRWRFPGA